MGNASYLPAKATLTPPDNVDPTTFLDQSNPRSLINLMHPELRDAILALNPEELQRDESYYRKNFEKDFFSVSDWRMRTNFWYEYVNAQAANRNFRPWSIWSGVSTKPVFDARFLKEPKRLAFLICPVADMTVALREAMQQGTNQLRELVTAKIIRPDGTMDARAAKVALDALIFLDAKLNGGIVQHHKVEQTSLNVNTSPEQLATSQKSSEQIRARIKELEQQLSETPLAVREHPKELGVVEDAELVENKLDEKPPEKEVVSEQTSSDKEQA